MNLSKSVFFLFFISFLFIGFLVCILLSGIGINLFGTHNEISQESTNENNNFNSLIDIIRSNDTLQNMNKNIIIIFNNFTKPNY